MAAHRRSLENKTVELTEKPPRKSLNDSKTPTDIRKSMESLDEKKTTPPPVLGKKPTVPIKKSPSAATSAVGNLFSNLGLKPKVKGAQSHDAQDGVGSSRLTQVADNNDKEVTGVKMRKDEEFDQVERGSYLQDPRQNRAKGSYNFVE